MVLRRRADSLDTSDVHAPVRAAATERLQRDPVAESVDELPDKVFEAMRLEILEVKLTEWCDPGAVSPPHIGRSI